MANRAALKPLSWQRFVPSRPSHRFISGALVLVLALSPFVYRSITAFLLTPKASRNIFEQQYQMGLFIREHYQGRVIAANDIGAINFLADVRLLDLFGLGSLEPASLKLQNRYGPLEIGELASKRQVDLAMIYDIWFTGAVPSTWVKVGEWTITDNVICGDAKVSFYAVGADTQASLVHSLKQFQGALPRDVLQTGLYLGN
jgi:hypothetical protein